MKKEMLAVKKYFIIPVFIICILVLHACGGAETDTRPEDFSFSVVFGTYGESYYNSETCSLVKTTNATNPEQYVTNMQLTPQALDEIYRCIVELDMDAYPAEYDPFNGVSSDPSQTLILTVSGTGFGEKQIVCENICVGYECDKKKGQKFLSAMKDIIDIIRATDEWQALPEYEFFYD